MVGAFVLDCCLLAEHCVWWSSPSGPLSALSCSLPDSPFPILLLSLLASSCAVNVSFVEFAHIYMDCIAFHILIC